MNLQSLRYIIAIEQFGSINKAAQNLYVSQSSLSRAIHEIESQIGISLFQRTNKGVIPTYDGKQFMEKAQSILQQLDDLEGQYYSSLNAHEEKLCVITQRCTPVIDSFIEYYQKRCTESEFLNLVLKEDTTDNIIQSVYNKLFDIGIFHYTSDQESAVLKKCSSMCLETHLLDVSPVAAQVRVGHPLTAYSSVTVNMLSPYPHVTFSDEDITNINYCSDISQYNPAILKKRIVIQDRGTLRHIVNNTNSYYIGCDFSNIPSYHGLTPVYIPLSDVSFTIKTLWIKNKSHPLSDAEESFLRILGSLYQCRSKQEEPYA